MTTASQQASAQIFQFPARGRFAAGNARGDIAAVQSNAPQVTMKAAVGSGWYHEAAITEDAERARNR